MSLAGIRSNKGDSYQILVALDWALTTLVDPDYQWLEVDSTTWAVDDIVIGKVDGTLICCQCKKNQPEFTAWSVADLADELDKASRLLTSNPQAEVRFYSRSPFGALGKLREHSTTQPDEVSYLTSLTQPHKKTDEALAALLVKTQSLSTYDFLRRTTFETSHELDRMEALLRERLHRLASNANVAYDALWRRLSHLGARLPSSQSESISAQHRLSKDNLKALLSDVGATLVPIMSLAEIRASFSSTSVIGRAWRRDIAGQRISSPVECELLAAIDARQRSILLTGMPGSGKTCVLLAVQETLELRAQTDSSLTPLFIQSREFADLATTQDRQAQGLHEQWVEKVARLAEESHVVVVIDSLDVLSISREHSALTYFLAQIDRLLLIPNVTLLTACRDFDRRYDRRIAERIWDNELKCPALDWDKDVSPLLQKLDIDATYADAATRELIQNPRELALYVELAQRDGSFNVVTSQALAQRYLDTLVRSDSALGDAAIQAIESIADEMLKSRSLCVPHQRFGASSATQRTLLSHNVLHETQDGRLAFGHQTLLDVLVISAAVRRGVTLNEFIQSLPPVPFVRPSIRSFVTQLTIGDRRILRKQLRTVFMGGSAFHIRRLVAESFAEQPPEDDDWPLIRDLRKNYRDVFQVIYTQANNIHWHHFWFKHLVPVLKDTEDVDGLMMHLNRSSTWVNEDPSIVLSFWTELLTLECLDSTQIAERLGYSVSNIDIRHSALLTPLLEKLLHLPQQQHSALGRSIARSIRAGAANDAMLWQFVAGGISDADAIDLHQLSERLRCRDHEIDERREKFFAERMKQSSELLNLALQSIERWSHLRVLDKGGWAAGSIGFLRHTSYQDAHSQHDHRHVDAEHILLRAIEAAILDHAETNSTWWQSNRERLCFSQELALRYFAILACTASPGTNIDIVERMLCHEELLKSELSYEIGSLISTAFILLDAVGQDAVLSAILATPDEQAVDESLQPWILAGQAQLIAVVPCHLRSAEAQLILNAYEGKTGALVRQPQIQSWGGMVSVPFPFEVFFNTGDNGVLRLLAHYSGYMRDFDDFLVGGTYEVASQLREASSRDPARFLRFLALHWAAISVVFRDAIMEGVANYLAYRYGNLQSGSTWIPHNEPDASCLAINILDELEEHPDHWRHNRPASNALNACAHIIQAPRETKRLVLLIADFLDFQEESPIKGDRVDLLTTGINMVRGHVVEAAMILVNKLKEKNESLPEQILPLLRQFSSDENPAIRALILRRLAYLQSQAPELGWELFHSCMQGDTTGLWTVAEPCLYYSYYKHFERVSPLLTRLCEEGVGEDLEVWGRISALAALSDRVEFSVLLQNLEAIEATTAWSGAAAVWTHAENLKQHREQCFAGLEAGLSASAPHAGAVADQMSSLFRIDGVGVSIELLNHYFAALESKGTNNHNHIYGLDKWLTTVAQRDPEEALTATEIYLAYVRRNSCHMYDDGNNLTQLLNRLFGEAEEREEADEGVMLQRVVSVQDDLLALGVTAVSDWLKAAERP
ncbi:AAA family ATPase [Pseudomonas sp. NPDC087697]|uniref:AAA family ATPase n=1 Tax=Pseudomonas sp. NPDC087697 TaxID=3364447 RepID=UPI00381AB92D